MAAFNDFILPEEILLAGIGKSACQCLDLLRKSDFGALAYMDLCGDSEISGKFTGEYNSPLAEAAQSSGNISIFATFPEIKNMPNPELLQSRLDKAKLVFLVSGLENGAFAELVLLLAQKAQAAGKLLIAAILHPLDFEGPSRMRLAETTLSLLKKSGCHIITTPSTAMAGVPTAAIEELSRQRMDAICAAIRIIFDFASLEMETGEDLKDIKKVLSDLCHGIAYILPCNEACENLQKAIQACIAAASDKAAKAVIYCLLESQKSARSPNYGKLAAIGEILKKLSSSQGAGLLGGMEKIESKEDQLALIVLN